MVPGGLTGTLGVGTSRLLHIAVSWRGGREGGPGLGPVTQQKAFRNAHSLAGLLPEEYEARGQWLGLFAFPTLFSHHSPRLPPSLIQWWCFSILRKMLCKGFFQPSPLAPGVIFKIVPNVNPFIAGCQGVQGPGEGALGGSGQCHLPAGWKAH